MTRQVGCIECAARLQGESAGWGALGAGPCSACVVGDGVAAHGEVVDIHSAQPDASGTDPIGTSGTRYVVSDASIATVSDDGLITALRSGRVTISIVHLASQLAYTYDADGKEIGRASCRERVCVPV